MVEAPCEPGCVGHDEPPSATAGRRLARQGRGEDTSIRSGSCEARRDRDLQQLGALQPQQLAKGADEGRSIGSRRVEARVGLVALAHDERPPVVGVGASGTVRRQMRHAGPASRPSTGTPCRVSPASTNASKESVPRSSGAHCSTSPARGTSAEGALDSPPCSHATADSTGEKSTHRSESQRWPALSAFSAGLTTGSARTRATSPSCGAAPWRIRRSTVQTKPALSVCGWLVIVTLASCSHKGRRRSSALATGGGQTNTSPQRPGTGRCAPRARCARGHEQPGRRSRPRFHSPDPSPQHGAERVEPSRVLSA